MGAEPLGPDLVDDAESFAEAGQALDERVQSPVGYELIASSQCGDEALPYLAAIAEGLDELEVLVEGTV
jgi:hypothetical protein